MVVPLGPGDIPRSLSSQEGHEQALESLAADSPFKQVLEEMAEQEITALDYLLNLGGKELRSVFRRVDDESGAASALKKWLESDEKDKKVAGQEFLDSLE